MMTPNSVVFPANKYEVYWHEQPEDSAVFPDPDPDRVAGCDYDPEDCLEEIFL